jgi:hypothetical protein
MHQIQGTNLGLRRSANSPDPIVYIGNRTCSEPVLKDSTLVECTALASAVGAYPVVGTPPGALLAMSALDRCPIVVARIALLSCSFPQCPEQHRDRRFASAVRCWFIWHSRAGVHRVSPGDADALWSFLLRNSFASLACVPKAYHLAAYCGPSLLSLQNAECVALFPLPLVRSGFFSLSMTKFVSCVPAAACPGVDAAMIVSAFSERIASGAMRYVACLPAICSLRVSRSINADLR